MKPLLALLIVGLMATAVRADPPPQQDYMLYCMGCHQRDGGGWGERVPTIHGVDRYLRVPEGREFLVRVPGVAHASLSDRRLAALLNWVLTEFGTTNFEPYTEAEVAPLRARPFINPPAAREEMLRRLAESSE